MDCFIVGITLLAHLLDIGAYARTVHQSVPFLFMYYVKWGALNIPFYRWWQITVLQTENGLLLDGLNDDTGRHIFNGLENWLPGELFYANKKEAIKPIRRSQATGKVDVEHIEQSRMRQELVLYVDLHVLDPLDRKLWHNEDVDLHLRPSESF